MKLILLRHGQSQWNFENRFTGWTDVDLTGQGILEAQQAAEQLLKAQIRVEAAFTSRLKRAIRTLWIVLDQIDAMWLPYQADWRLNERHYGALQGLNKAEMAEQMGAEQVFAWRRTYEARPPALEFDDPRHPRFDPRYADIEAARLPSTESLRDTLTRVLECWQAEIMPRLQSGQSVLVVAHGNSLRSLIKHLEGIPNEAVASLNVPTGIPIVYSFDADLRVASKELLGDSGDIRAKTEAFNREMERLRQGISLDRDLNQAD